MHLKADEKIALEPLFNYIFFENYGAFVLFGSKPLCEIQLPPYLSIEDSKRMLEEIPEEIKKNGRLVEVKTNYYERWERWKKIQSRFSIVKYLFVERSQTIFLIDIGKTARVFKENYDFFKKITGKNFSPINAVFEIQDQNSDFWKKVFQNHIAMGLLYGFGKDNAELFDRNMSSESSDFSFSTDKEIEIFRANMTNFTIPIFIAPRDHPLIQLYEKEKHEIEHLYKGKDLFDVTMAQLTR